MKLARVPRSCPHQDCPSHVPGNRPRITRHATVRTRTRKVPRFLCGACRRTFTASAGTPYHRLRVRRDEFDRAVAMSVEGMSTSSIARALGVAWNTADRWLTRAADAATRVSDAAMRNVDAGEVQADELRTFVESKEHKASSTQNSLRARNRDARRLSACCELVVTTTAPFDMAS